MARFGLLNMKIGLLLSDLVRQIKFQNAAAVATLFLAALMALSLAPWLPKLATLATALTLAFWCSLAALGKPAGREQTRSLLLVCTPHSTHKSREHYD